MKTNNNTLQEKALKLKKQRRNRIIASLLGIAIPVSYTHLTLPTTPYV